MTTTSSSSNPDFSNLGEDHVSSLLRLALEDGRRPVDDLIDRLGQPDGPAWLVGTIDALSIFSHEALTQQLVEGQATLEQLVAIKDESKSTVGRGEDSGSRLVAMWVYFVTVAAALMHYGALICSRDRDELDPILLDLAVVAPPPWSELLGRATLAPREPDPPNTP